MQNYFLLWMFLFLGSCNSNKSVVKTYDLKIANAISNCPENGICTLQLLQNQELILQRDAIGKIFYTTLPNPRTSIIVYEYSKKVPEGLQDASYREEIIFEIENASSDLHLTNAALGQTKMLFGRHCFCKGYAGYFFVQEGSLEVVKNKSDLSFRLDFKMDEVPQVITKIKTN